MGIETLSQQQAVTEKDCAVLEDVQQVEGGNAARVTPVSDNPPFTLKDNAAFHFVG